MHDAADDPSSTLVVCKLITTRLSVAKCQYCPRCRKVGWLELTAISETKVQTDNTDCC